MLRRRLGGPKRWSGRFCRRETFLALFGIRTLDLPDSRPATTSSTLAWFVCVVGNWFESGSGHPLTLRGFTLFFHKNFELYRDRCRSQWPRGLRGRFAAARLLGLWVRILQGAWIFVVIVVLPGRGLCDEPIIRPEESYRLCCVLECDLETL